MKTFLMPRHINVCITMLHGGIIRLKFSNQKKGHISRNPYDGTLNSPILGG